VRVNLGKRFEDQLLVDERDDEVNLTPHPHSGKSLTLGVELIWFAEVSDDIHLKIGNLDEPVVLVELRVVDAILHPLIVEGVVEVERVDPHLLQN